MRKSVLTSLITASLLLIWYVNKSDEDNSHTMLEYKYSSALEIPSFIESATIMQKRGYTIGFSKKHKHAYWVAYQLKCSETNGNVARGNYFREDQILGKYSPSSNDYYASGYDKGHLLPAGDNKSDSVAMYDSFLMSNVSPQIPAFNRGIWKRLEEQVRKWACQYDSIYVVTGAFLNDSLTSIGKGKVSVPDFYYKSILAYSKEHQSTISFYMYQYTEEENFFAFALSTDSLESKLGYDLFPNLDDKAENQIESRVDSSFWGFE